jgi:hypothetical protein
MVIKKHRHLHQLGGAGAYKTKPSFFQAAKSRVKGAFTTNAQKQLASATVSQKKIKKYTDVVKTQQTAMEAIQAKINKKTEKRAITPDFTAKKFNITKFAANSQKRQKSIEDLTKKKDAISTQSQNYIRSKLEKVGSVATNVSPTKVGSVSTNASPTKTPTIANAFAEKLQQASYAKTIAHNANVSQKLTEAAAAKTDVTKKLAGNVDIAKAKLDATIVTEKGKAEKVVENTKKETDDVIKKATDASKDVIAAANAKVVEKQNLLKNQFGEMTVKSTTGPDGKVITESKPTRLEESKTALDVEQANILAMIKEGSPKDAVDTRVAGFKKLKEEYDTNTKKFDALTADVTKAGSESVKIQREQAEKVKKVAEEQGNKLMKVISEQEQIVAKVTADQQAKVDEAGQALRKSEYSINTQKPLTVAELQAKVEADKSKSIADKAKSIFRNPTSILSTSGLLRRSKETIDITNRAEKDNLFQSLAHKTRNEKLRMLTKKLGTNNKLGNTLLSGQKPTTEILQQQRSSTKGALEDAQKKLAETSFLNPIQRAKAQKRVNALKRIDTLLESKEVLETNRQQIANSNKIAEVSAAKTAKEVATAKKVPSASPAAAPVVPSPAASVLAPAVASPAAPSLVPAPVVAPAAAAPKPYTPDDIKARDGVQARIAHSRLKPNANLSDLIEHPERANEVFFSPDSAKYFLDTYKNLSTDELKLAINSAETDPTKRAKIKAQADAQAKLIRNQRHKLRETQLTARNQSVVGGFRSKKHRSKRSKHIRSTPKKHSKRSKHSHSRSARKHSRSKKNL